MLVWLQSNLGTILVLLAVCAIAAAVWIGMIRDKRRGKSSCGCGCSCCALKGSCHSGK